MDNNLAISQIPICTRIYEYLNWKDKLEFKKICKGVNNNLPKIRCRVVNIDHLNDSDMDVTIFIESNPHNDPEINKLVKVIEFMTNKKQILTTFTARHIYWFFKSPLSKVFKIGSCTAYVDNNSVHMLLGKFVFPLEIPNENTTKKSLAIKLKKLLGSTKYPEWEDFCEHTIEIA
jgi:hypothetical protein